MRLNEYMGGGQLSNKIINKIKNGIVHIYFKDKGVFKSMKNKLIIIVLILILVTSFNINQASANSLTYKIFDGNISWHNRGWSFPAKIYYEATVNSINIGIESPNDQMFNMSFWDGDYNITTMSIPQESVWFVRQLLQGCEPDTLYNVNTNKNRTDSASSPGGYGPVNTQFNFKLYTDAYVPTGIYFPTVGINSIKINWNNQQNKDHTSYTLQRSTDNINWTEVSTQTGMNEYVDTGLSSQTRYYYRIRVNEKRGTYKYSGVIYANTSVDPAVAAAKASQTAAEAAKQAAQETKTLAQSNFDKINNPTYGLLALKNEILNIKTSIDSNKTVPTINYLKGLNNTTATKYFFIILDTSVDNATHYRIKGGIWQNYTDNQIMIEGIEKGINRIEIDFGNLIEKDGAFEGSTTKGIINIFGV